MHFPSCNTVFSVQVRHLGLLGPQLLQDWSQANGEEKATREGVTVSNTAVTLSLHNAPYWHQCLSVSFPGCSEELCVLDSKRQRALCFPFCGRRIMEELVTEQSATNTPRHSHQPIRFHMGFKAEMALEAGLTDLANKNTNFQLSLSL